MRRILPPIVLAALIAANWLVFLDATPRSLQAGRVLEARESILSFLNGGTFPDALAVRDYLQARHLSQGAEAHQTLRCGHRPADQMLACRSIQAMISSYDKVAPPEQRGDGVLPMLRGSSGHVAVQVRSLAAEAPMIIDTGSMATILPALLHDAVVRPLRTTRVSNLGRPMTLELVRAHPLQLGDTLLPNWIAARSAAGFQREGVLGLDVIYALGGVEFRPRKEEVAFLGGECASGSAKPFAFVNGAVIADVLIDGQTHRALLDTGSVRTFVFDERAGQGQVRVGSDFGDASIAGRIVSGQVEVGGLSHRLQVVRISSRAAFVEGTTALVGADMLLSGKVFGLCFEPGRYWIE